MLSTVLLCILPSVSVCEVPVAKKTTEADMKKHISSAAGRFKCCTCRVYREQLQAETDFNADKEGKHGRWTPEGFQVEFFSFSLFIPVAVAVELPPTVLAAFYVCDGERREEGKLDESHKGTQRNWRAR